LHNKELFVKIGKRVADLRKASGKTQADIAETTDLSNESISRLERGVSMPSVGTLVKIAQAIGVDPCEFFDWKKDFEASEKDILIRSVSDLLSTRSKADVQMVYDVVVRMLKK